MAFGKGSTVNGRGNLLGAALMAILAGRLSMRLARDAMRAAMTADAIGSIDLTLSSGFPVRSGVIGIRLLGMAILAAASVPCFERPQAVRSVTVHAGRGCAAVSAACEHLSDRLMTIQARFLGLGSADHGVRFTMTTQAGWRVYGSLSQKLAMRASIIDIFDVLMASDAIGGLQRAGVRIIFEAG